MYGRTPVVKYHISVDHGMIKIAPPRVKRGAINVLP